MGPSVFRRPVPSVLTADSRVIAVLRARNLSRWMGPVGVRG